MKQANVRRIRNAMHSLQLFVILRGAVDAECHLNGPASGTRVRICIFSLICHEGILVRIITVIMILPLHSRLYIQINSATYGQTQTRTYYIISNVITMNLHCSIVILLGVMRERDSGIWCI